MDYVAGMDLLDTAGYRFLTEAEAIAGIDGTWVNPINPRTSVGPPLNQKKYLHFSRDEEGVSMSPDM